MSDEEDFDPENIYEDHLDFIEEQRAADPPIPEVIHHNSISPWNKINDGVTTLYRCEATDAKVLYIFDIAYKLQQNDHYDIGGAYTDVDSGIWFYFVTTTCPGYNYLMNIFVCQRQPGIFSLGISNSNTTTSAIYNGDKVVMLPEELDTLHFNSSQPDTVHYIKTFCFSDQERKSLQNNILVIPIKIDLLSKSILNKNVLQKIKTEQDFGKQLLKDQEPDFILTSGSGKEFKVHKIVLAAHSSVIRDSIRPKDCNTLRLNIADEEVNLLLQYLYTGTIDDILEQNYVKLLEMADTFQLYNLSVLLKYAIKTSINSSNALFMATLAEKHNFKEIQEVAFKYIKMHPEVLTSDEFSEIDNTNLIKKLLKYIHVKDGK